MKPVKLLLTADWHIDAVTAGIPRVSEIDQFVDELKEAIIRERVNHLIHLGDFFDPGGMFCSHYTAKTIDLVSKLIDGEFLDSVVLIAGNHDVIESSLGVTTISPVASAFSRSRDRVFVVEQPEVISLRSGEQKLRVLALPFVARSSQRENAVSEALQAAIGLSEDPLVVVGHMTVPGALMGSESVEMTRGRNLVLPVEEIGKLRPKLIANGHYHKSQIIQQGKRAQPVVIPGSPFRFTFGEKDDTKKGFTIVEIA